MLGPIGRIAKSALMRAGYEIAKPTRFERSLPRDVFSDWFTRDIAQFATIYRDNRQVLGQVPAWFRADDLERSLGRYGLSEEWESDHHTISPMGINQIQTEPTYSDLIVFIAKALSVPIQYLEIGVSVGKNFLQICKALPEARIVGLDAENVNPVLAEQFAGKRLAWESGLVQRIDTLCGGTKDGTLELAKYELARPGHEPVVYLRGDQFSADTWASLDGYKFNLIFSDGVHTPEAILSEVEFLLGNRQICDEGPFAMYWDDLIDEPMQSAFVTNAERLKKHFGGRGRYALYRMHGTYAPARLTGAFTTLD
jgi:hypothetical protein